MKRLQACVSFLPQLMILTPPSDGKHEGKKKKKKTKEKKKTQKKKKKKKKKKKVKTSGRQAR